MRKEIIAIGIIAMIAVCATLAMAAPSNSQKDVTATSVAEAVIEIKLDNDILNLQSNGKYVTVLIYEVVDYELEDVNVDTVNLIYDGVVLAAVDPDAPTYIRDCDGDGDVELMVKFDRAAVQGMLVAGEEVEITISGEVAGIVFEGTDIIRIMDN